MAATGVSELNRARVSLSAIRAWLYSGKPCVYHF